MATRPYLGIVIFLLPSFGFCAEWSLKSSIDQFLGYDTNVRMRQDAQGSFFYKIIPTLTLSRKTEISEVTANAMYGTQTYTDVSGFNQDIQNYGLNGIYKTQRFDWGLTLNHSSTPSRNNALENSGNFAANSINTTQTVSPSLTYHISEIDNLTLTPSYSATSYTNASINNFRNYNTTNIDLAWQRMWTERYMSSISFFYSIFESQQGSNSSGSSSFNYDSYGINFGNDYALTEKWKLSGTVGVRQTESTTDFGSSSSAGFLADLNADYTADNFTSGINFKRSLMPSSFGRLQEQTAVGWNFNYKILERLSTNFNLYYLESTLVNFNNNAIRKNLVIQPGISWQLTPEWTLAGSYRFRTQDSNQNSLGNLTNNLSAESHLVMLTINYNWQGLSLSK